MKNIAAIFLSSTIAAIILSATAATTAAAAAAADSGSSGARDPAPISHKLITTEFLAGLSALNSTHVIRPEDLSRAIAEQKAPDVKKNEFAVSAAPGLEPEATAAPSRPEPPARVFAVFQNGVAFIVWDIAPGADRGYNIYRVGKDRVFELITPAPIRAERYMDPSPGGDSGVAYYIESVGADKSRGRLSPPSAAIRAGFKIIP